MLLGISSRIRYLLIELGAVVSREYLQLPSSSGVSNHDRSGVTALAVKSMGATGRNRRSSNVSESKFRRRGKPFRYQVCVEPFEPRRLLSAVTWVGDIDANWSSIRAITSPPFGINTNWSSNSLPGSGDTIVFPSGARSSSNNDNSGSVSVAGIQITGVAAGNQRYTIGGNSVTLTGASGVDVTAGVDGSGRGPQVSLPLKLAANTAVNVSNPATTLELTGAITGNFSLNKTGAGTLLLTNSNNFFGAPLATQTITAGTLRLGASNAFPGKLALTVNSGATFDLGNLNAQVAHLTFGQGTIKLGSATLTIGTPFGAIGGADSDTITGTGGITIDYGTEQTLNGTTANTYTGATRVINGSLVLAKAPGVVSVPGDLIIGSPTGTSTDDIATVGLDGDGGSDEQIADTATVVIDPGGELFLASR
jgi:autotransporter-associated beta strand protein